MKILLLSFCTLLSYTIHARPMVKSINPLNSSVGALNFLNTPDQFEGIVRFSNCSGSLVTFKGMPKTKKAIVMTNGHCVNGTSATITLANRVENKEVAVFDNQMKRSPLKLDLLLYGTQNGTDVGFYRATMTYDEIENKYGVEPFIIDDEIVSIGTKIDVVSGYWAQITSCEAESIVPVLREAEWAWKNSVRYSAGCMTRGGFSGSPVIVQNTRTVVAIHNTGNNGRLDCSDMNPCEQDENGTLIFRTLNRRYAQQIFQFYGCLTRSFDFDFKLDTCRVAKP